MKICVIPARGGSKRIPRKNIRSFLGKPVIAYPIEAAIASSLFDAVVVSTNDSEIADIAKQYGAEVPFMRPEALSDDHTATAPVLIHAIEWYESQGHTVEEMACLYPSTPFLNPDLLQDGYRVWKEAESPYCFAVSEFHSAPQRALKLSEQGRAVSLYPEFQQTRTQDLPPTFFDAGMFYFCDAQIYKSGVSMHSDSAVPFVLPRHLAHDIDTLEDWDFAEKFYKFLHTQ